MGSRRRHTAWTFEQKQDALRVVRNEGDKILSDIECNKLGRDCKYQDAGKPASASMWFSGPKLVMLETAGNQVTKRRFVATGDGQVVMEVIPVVPPGKTITVQLKKSGS
jgi:hypothetical protein